MAIIGHFTREKTGFVGTIETLACGPAAIRIQPVTKPNAKAPDYRVYRGSSEVGAAWSKRAQNGREYLAVTLDDPAFTSPVVSRLVAVNGGYALLWSRE